MTRPVGGENDKALNALSRLLDPVEPARANAALSTLNGVLGDYPEGTGNPLADPALVVELESVRQQVQDRLLPNVASTRTGGGSCAHSIVSDSPVRSKAERRLLASSAVITARFAGTKRAYARPPSTYRTEQRVDEREQPLRVALGPPGRHNEPNDKAPVDHCVGIREGDVRGCPLVAGLRNSPSGESRFCSAIATLERRAALQRLQSVAAGGRTHAV